MLTIHPEEVRLRPTRPLLWVLAALLVGGGVLAWFALRERSGGPPKAGGPEFVVKSTGNRNLLERLDGAELLAVNAAGERHSGGGVAALGDVPAGAREVRVPLPPDLTRFRVQFRLRTEGGAPGPWQDLGPYEVGASTPGARVLQVGLVLSEEPGPVQLDAASGGLEELFLTARVNVHVRLPAGGEMWETLGTLHVKPTR